jgi:hypothetical protein
MFVFPLLDSCLWFTGERPKSSVFPPHLTLVSFLCQCLWLFLDQTHLRGGISGSIALVYLVRKVGDLGGVSGSRSEAKDGSKLMSLSGAWDVFLMSLPRHPLLQASGHALSWFGTSSFLLCCCQISGYIEMFHKVGNSLESQTRMGPVLS